MNAYDIYQMFYIPLYYTKLDGVTDSIKNEIVNPNIFSYIRYDNDKCWMSDTYQLLNLKVFESLKQKILESVRVYTRDVLRISYNLDYKIVSSWSLKHKQDDYSKHHMHHNSIISGVYYPIVNNDSGKIWFYREASLFTPTVKIDYIDYNSNNCNSFFIMPEMDSLILFPSQISHSVDKNKSNMDRFSIAFNIFFEGNFSTFESKIDDLNIKITDSKVTVD